MPVMQETEGIRPFADDLPKTILAARALGKDARIMQSGSIQ
jgi:hypothetical protein